MIRQFLAATAAMATALALTSPAVAAAPAKAKETEFWYSRPLQLNQSQATSLKAPPAAEARPRATPLREIQRRTQENSYEMNASNPGSEFNGAAAFAPLAHCAKQKVGHPKIGLVESHFLFCTKGNADLVHQSGKKITGRIPYYLTVAGIGHNGKRQIDFQIKATGIVPWGDMAKLDIHLQFYIYCGPMRATTPAARRAPVRLR
ncbi:hypothetical protein [Actinomadura harenae]|uniref:hypothetical protein n=1 Tax=Actinomadura harenae TaxID=2483351 RepID=UPI0011C39754|nr:hypothetical protein [Actinomadura harenae]